MTTVNPHDSSELQSSGPKLFSVAHARRTLPLVRKIVADITDVYEQVRKQAGTAGRLDSSRPEHEALINRLEDLLEELSEIGCILKDWRLGLVDFISLYQGRQVELCWKHGEETIAYWHELSQGYAGRQQIDAEFERETERLVAMAETGEPQAV